MWITSGKIQKKFEKFEPIELFWLFILFQEILKFLKEQECEALPRPNYMDKQPYITWNMRSVLVDWLVCVAEEYKMSEDSLYLAVNYIDRFLSKISVVSIELNY